MYNVRFCKRETGQIDFIQLFSLINSAQVLCIRLKAEADVVVALI